ncbi:MAG: Grx4 family monothiol glutaredoxin [Pseudomonadota bacterium]
MDTTAAQAVIKDHVDNNDVVLFMKGTTSMPQCGFSSRVSQILTFMGVAYKDVNILESDEMRQGIKDFSDWPTTPQLYVKGDFIGGCDIVTEMTLDGSLDKMLAESGVAFDEAAAEKIREHNKQA